MTSRKRQIKAETNDFEPCEKQYKAKESDIPQSTKDDCIATFPQFAQLGKGSYGNVHIWFNYNTSKIYAGKSFKTEDDFRREYEQVTSLKHTNVLMPVKVLQDKG